MKYKVESKKEEAEEGPMPHQEEMGEEHEDDAKKKHGLHVMIMIGAAKDLAKKAGKQLRERKRGR